MNKTAVLQLKRQDEFLDAYDKYGDPIYRHCYFRVYNKEIAEDLTQETFIKTWRYITEGKEIQNIKAFLYKVAVNLVIDHQRKKTSVPLDDIKEKEFSFRHSNNTGEHGIVAHSEAAFVIDKVGVLEEKYRDIILMRYVQDFSPAEIADILEISPNVVSVRLNYAIKKLKKIIKK